MNTCPFFGKCGGCRFDFASGEYRANKMALLRDLPITDDAIWIDGGLRRRADFCFNGDCFGLFQARSKNVIPITHCCNVVPEINALLPDLAALPWVGTGGCLVTMCDNGVDVNVTSTVPYVTPEFRTAAEKLKAIRITWNDKIVVQRTEPRVSFGDVSVSYPPNSFLQPTVLGADIMRKMVVDAANGYARIADLFCGLGNFTFALGADGFDIVGTGVKRDLFKNPLTLGMLAGYDCVVMDPPRAGAREQCLNLAKSDVRRVIYVSCNPQTFRTDMEILTRGGYKLTKLIPLDQFPGSTHWELFSIFDK